MSTQTLTSNNSIFQWIDVCAPTEDELMSLGEQYKIHKYTLRDCLEPDHLPKYEVIEDTVFIISRLMLNLPIDRSNTIQQTTSKLAFFYNDSTLITVHRLPLDFIEEVRVKFVLSNKCATPSDLVVRLLWHVLSTYEKPGLDLLNEIDNYEEKVFLKDMTSETLKKLYFIKRRTHLANKLLILTIGIISQIKTKDLIALGDLKDYGNKLNNFFSQNLDDIHSLMNFYLSLSSQKTNEVIRILTIFSAFFLPLTFIAGVYGMNFHNMPELSQPYGYFYCLVLMVLVTLIIFQWFKRKRWL